MAQTCFAHRPGLHSGGLGVQGRGRGILYFAEAFLGPYVSDIFPSGIIAGSLGPSLVLGLGVPFHLLCIE